jgi:prepilin-type N-terminal cleavage/methylation domain-containing protein/prepilin-type processing-associated H-X9-DG protein
MRTMRRPSAFTLIELLVVVAIIALLISILLPSLSAARGQAKQLLCVTNLRTMGHAVHFYAEDNRQTIVHSESQWRNSNYGMHFAASLLRGIGYNGTLPLAQIWEPGRGRRLWDICAAQKVYQCPSFPTEPQPLDYVVSAYTLPYAITSGDGVNSNKVGNGPVSSAAERRFFSKKDELDGRNPAELIYIAEAHQNHDADPVNGWGQLHDLFELAHLPFGSQPRVSNDRRHPGGVTVLFYDGHAEARRPQRIDVGWPGLRIDRLRWFTVVEEAP